MCIFQVLCIRPNSLYIVKYNCSRSVSDIWNTIFNIIKIMSLMACHSSSWNAIGQSSSFWRQASIFYGWNFLMDCIFCLLILLTDFLTCRLDCDSAGFDAPEIKVTVCTNTFHKCLLRRRARNYLLMQRFGIRASMQLPCPLLPIWFLLKKR